MKRGQNLSLSPFEQENNVWKSEFTNVNRILIRGVNWVGDTILTYPSVQGVKELFPRARVSILIPETLIDLWKTFPYIDDIIPFQKRKGVGSIREDVRISQTMRRGRFDLAIIFPRSFRSAFQIFLARIPIRIGYQDEGRSIFLTHNIRRKQEFLHTHRVHYYRKLIEPLGNLGKTPSPQLVLRKEDRDWADHKIREMGLLDGRPLIGFNPGAAYGLAKCWPPDRFAELGQRLSERWKATVLIFGREEERAMAVRILERIGVRGVDLTGKTSLLQLAALLERCQILVTNDTGTMHVASAVGTPVVAIFGSTDPITTGPWGDGHMVIRKDVSCSPCLKRVCPMDHRCMKLITVDEVEEVVKRRLEDLNNQTPITKHQIISNNQ